MYCVGYSRVGGALLLPEGHRFVYGGHHVKQRRRKLIFFPSSGLPLNEFNNYASGFIAVKDCISITSMGTQQYFSTMLLTF